MNDDPVDDVYIAGGGLSSFSLIWHVAKAWDLPNVPFSIRIAEKQGEGSLGIYTENVGYGGNEHTINLYGKLMQPQTGIKGRSLINPGVAELLQLPSEVPASTEDIGKYINKKRLSSVLHGRLRYLKVSTRNLPRGLFAGFTQSAAERAIRAKNGQLSKTYKTEVIDASYDKEKRLWKITESNVAGGEQEIRWARTFVDATGHEKEYIPQEMRSLQGYENFYSGHDKQRGIYARLRRVKEASPTKNWSTGVAGTGLTALDIARTYVDSKGDLPPDFLLFSRNRVFHILPQKVPPAAIEPIRNEIAEIRKVLNPELFQAVVDDSTPQALDAVKAAFERAKKIAEEYTTNDPDVQIPESRRGRVRAKTYTMPAYVLRRALLGQAVVVSLMRGITLMKRKFPKQRNGRSDYGWTENAEKACTFLDNKIMRSEEHASWITANSTAASDENIKLTLKIIREQKVIAATPVAYETASGEKIRVRFKDKDGRPTDNRFNELYNCTGQESSIPDRSVTGLLLRNGSFSKHFTGRGLAVDEHGRAIPKERTAGEPPPLYALGPKVREAYLFHRNPEIPSLPPISASGAPGINNSAYVMAKHLVSTIEKGAFISANVRAMVSAEYSHEEEQTIFRVHALEIDQKFGENEINKDHKKVLRTAANKNGEVLVSSREGLLVSASHAPADSKRHFPNASHKLALDLAAARKTPSRGLKARLLGPFQGRSSGGR